METKETKIDEIIKKWDALGFLDYSTDKKNIAELYEGKTKSKIKDYRYLLIR